MAQEGLRRSLFYAVFAFVALRLHLHVDCGGEPQRKDCPWPFRAHHRLQPEPPQSDLSDMASTFMSVGHWIYS